MLVGFQLEDLDGFVGGTCCESSTVIVEDGIMLSEVLVQSTMRVMWSCPAYNHIIVPGVGDDMGLRLALAIGNEFPPRSPFDELPFWL
jgi:hypothetical protein